MSETKKSRSVAPGSIRTRGRPCCGVKPEKMECVRCNQTFDFTSEHFYPCRSNPWGLIKSCRECLIFIAKTVEEQNQRVKVRASKFHLKDFEKIIFEN